MYSVFDELLGMPDMVYVPWDMWDSNVHCVDDYLLSNGSLKTFSAVFFVHPIAQVFRRLKLEA